VVFVAVTRATRIRLLVSVSVVVLLSVAGAYRWFSGALPTEGVLKPVTHVSTSRPIVALTFDLTYGEKAPGEILNVLRACGAKCTFFVAAPWAQAHPDVLKRILNEGHELASQGYWHENLSASPHDRIILSLTKAHDVFSGITGTEPLLFRPPNGDYDDDVIRSALEVGYSTITWSLDSFDWRSPNDEYVVTRVTSKIRPGDIVRLHASDLSGQTARALPRIIRGLSQKGLAPVTVGELLRSAAD